MKAALLVLQLVALVIVLFIGLIVSSNVTGFAPDTSPPGSPDPAPTQEVEPAPTQAPGPAEPADSTPSPEELKFLFIVLGVCALEALVLAYPIRRSRWSGWKLIATVFLVFVGVKAVQPQIEAQYFNVLSVSMSGRVLLMVVVSAAIFSPLAVLILGRIRRSKTDDAPATGDGMGISQWAWKLAATALFYVILYTVFGHFIAWQSAEVREYYGATSMTGGLGELGLFQIPTLGPFQAFRGMLWVALGLPVIRMMKGKWWESGLALGLIFAVVMNAQLFLPNPYMPHDVRMVHLVETASSNFILGWWIAWLFRR